MVFFSGFAPSDMQKGPNGAVDGSHRRPFFLRLRIDVPRERSVAAASDDELASWLKPETNGGCTQWTSREAEHANLCSMSNLRLEAGERSLSGLIRTSSAHRPIEPVLARSCSSNFR